jgi:hypothetical protein
LQWLDSVKIAIIEEAYERLPTLFDHRPKNQNFKELQETKHLIDSLILHLKKEQKLSLITMEKIKKNREFLSLQEKKKRLSTLT